MPAWRWPAPANGRGIRCGTRHGLAQTGGRRTQLIGLRRGTNPVPDLPMRNGATQRAAAEESSATERRLASGDIRNSHSAAGLRLRAQSRD